MYALTDKTGMQQLKKLADTSRKQRIKNEDTEWNWNLRYHVFANALLSI